MGDRMPFQLRVLFAVSFAISLALAQDSRGTISGRVSDPHDAGIPGAQVSVLNIETGVATRLTTNDKGIYAAPLLIPGKYRVAAEHNGFKRAAQGDITLSVNDALQV